MAVVMALILLPTLIAAGSLLSIMGSTPSLAELLTGGFVLLLAGGAFYGLVHFIHTLEGADAPQ